MCHFLFNPKDCYDFHANSSNEMRKNWKQVF